MLSYDFVKAQGMETILKGVQTLALTRDHDQCKAILATIKATCDAQIALENIEIAREKGDVKGMLDAMRQFGI